LPHTFRKKYEMQLPKLRAWNLERYIALFSSLCGILSIFLYFFDANTIPLSVREFIFVSYLALIPILLLLYIFFKERKKLHRYSQSVFYMHFVNHVIRDYLKTLSSGDKQNFEETLLEILDAISNCYSILTGKRCRACIKELKNDLSLITVARDSHSRKNYHGTSKTDHPLEGNTDFYRLWYGTEGCYRYFLSNNIASMYTADDYKNTSFADYGKPLVWSKIITFVQKWPLPYKSTIVLPIRFIPDYNQWPPLRPPKEHKKVMETESAKNPHFLGFLCIDSNSKNVFDEVHAPELGAAFSDALYTLFSQAHYISLQQKMKKTIDK